MKENINNKKISISAEAKQAIAKRILLADDNMAIRDLVSEFLKFIGYEVAIAINGLEALGVFIASSFDLVLTDLDMPVMDGITLASHIKDRSPGTPVILLTGADRETILKKVEKGPIDSVIFKPFMMEDLERTVQEALTSEALK